MAQSCVNLSVQILVNHSENWDQFGAVLGTALGVEFDNSLGISLGITIRAMIGTAVKAKLGEPLGSENSRKLTVHSSLSL